MQIKWKASFVLIAVAVVSSIIASYSTFHSNQSIIESAKQSEMQSTVAFIQADLQAEGSKAAARASLIGNLPSIQEAFRAKDRDAMIKRLVPAFLIQRDKYGVREGHFHFAPAMSYLRLFDLSAQGEDLSKIREMIVATNRTQSPQTGIEVGRRGLSIRGMYPMRDAEGPIGSFEVGMAFETVLEHVKKVLGYEAAVFVDNELYTTVATGMPKLDAERLVGPLLNVGATDWKVVRPLVNADMLSRVADISMTTRSIDGIDYGTIVMPMLDYKGKQIGAIVAIRNFESYQTQLKAALVANIALALLQALALIGAILVLLNSQVYRPLVALREKLSAFIGGKPTVPVPELLKKNDEIGALAKEIQKLEASAPKEAAAKDDKKAGAANA